MGIDIRAGKIKQWFIWLCMIFTCTKLLLWLSAVSGIGLGLRTTPAHGSDFESRLISYSQDRMKTKLFDNNNNNDNNENNKTIIRTNWIEQHNNANYFDYGDISSCQAGGTVNKHVHLRRLFRLWIEAASLFNVSYALTHGALLGAWRNGQVIPYDHDLDLLVNHDEIVKLDRMTMKTTFDRRDGVHLVIHKEYDLPIEKRSRYLCSGIRVPFKMDACSTVEPLGRLIGPDTYIDLVGYKVRGNTAFFQTEDKHNIFPVISAVR